MLLKLFKAVFLLSIMASLATCKQAPAPEFDFYHWKNSFHWGAFEQDICHQFNSKRLYIKVLEIDAQAGQGAIPRAQTALHAADIAADIELVPVVFILNRVFQQLSDSLTEDLAGKTFKKVGAICAGKSISEIQIDCDWTAGTRSAYFHFLQALQSRCHTQNIQLSVTLRLHQIKYREKTGIPPADRGVLMLYNLNNPDNPQAGNSIFDPTEARAYLRHAKAYPMPIDPALPLFSWALHFRNGKLEGFLQNRNLEWAQNARFLTLAKENIFTVQRDTVLENTYFRPGDQIKIEACSLENLQLALNLAAPLQPDSPFKRILLFHLDPEVLKNTNTHALQTLRAH